MARYRLVKNQAGEYELWEVEPPPRGVPRLQIVGAKVRDAYRSPIDGSIITGQRSERQHMLRHGVVRPGDFGENDGRGYYERKAKERADFFQGESQAHHQEVKQDIVKAMQMVEQGHKPRVQSEGE